MRHIVSVWESGHYKQPRRQDSEDVTVFRPVDFFTQVVDYEFRPNHLGQSTDYVSSNFKNYCIIAGT